MGRLVDCRGDHRPGPGAPKAASPRAPPPRGRPTHGRSYPPPLRAGGAAALCLRAAAAARGQLRHLRGAAEAGPGPGGAGRAGLRAALPPPEPGPLLAQAAGGLRAGAPAHPRAGGELRRGVRHRWRHGLLRGGPPGLRRGHDLPGGPEAGLPGAGEHHDRRGDPVLLPLDGEARLPRPRLEHGLERGRLDAAGVRSGQHGGHLDLLRRQRGAVRDCLRVLRRPSRGRAGAHGRARRP
mmetsp:Transcript_112887/g.364383  ORF Transcript_112887/g.364383 Transcript_112887/m.364383 type:complete len:238 (+) Transcript_112887:1155-1868(+)